MREHFKQLVVCADDFGWKHYIDEGIVRLIEEGRVTATSCLTLSPRWFDAAKMLTPAIVEKADIGLHLDFTQFGDQYSLPTLIGNAITRRLDSKKLQKSIRHQIDNFEKALKIKPSYIDGHQHVHQFPQIRDVLLDTLLVHYKTALPWIRVTMPPQTGDIKSMFLRILGPMALLKKAGEMGFHCSGQLLGVYNFKRSEEDYQKLLDQWLETAAKAPDTKIPVLMCHPAVKASPDEITSDDPIYEARVREYNVLSGTRFLSALQKSHIHLRSGLCEIH